MLLLVTIGSVESCPVSTRNRPWDKYASAGIQHQFLRWRKDITRVCPPHAIETHVDDYRAETDGEIVYVRRDNDGPGFDNTVPELSTTDDGADIIVDETLAQEGDISIMDPYGLALTGAAAPDETIEVMVI